MKRNVKNNKAIAPGGSSRESTKKLTFRRLRTMPNYAWCALIDWHARAENFERSGAAAHRSDDGILVQALIGYAIHSPSTDMRGRDIDGNLAQPRRKHWDIDLEESLFLHVYQLLGPKRIHLPNGKRNPFYGSYHVHDERRRTQLILNAVRALIRLPTKESEDVADFFGRDRDNPNLITGVEQATNQSNEFIREVPHEALSRRLSGSFPLLPLDTTHRLLSKTLLNDR